MGDHEAGPSGRSTARLRGVLAAVPALGKAVAGYLEARDVESHDWA